jgi:hypothetical protein
MLLAKLHALGSTAKMCPIHAPQVGVQPQAIAALLPKWKPALTQGQSRTNGGIVADHKKEEPHKNSSNRIRLTEIALNTCSQASRLAAVVARLGSAARASQANGPQGSKCRMNERDKRLLVELFASSYEDSADINLLRHYLPSHNIVAPKYQISLEDAHILLSEMSETLTLGRLSSQPFNIAQYRAGDLILAHHFSTEVGLAGIDCLASYLVLRWCCDLAEVDISKARISRFAFATMMLGYVRARARSLVAMSNVNADSLDVLISALSAQLVLAKCMWLEVESCFDVGESVEERMLGYRNQRDRSDVAFEWLKLLPKWNDASVRLRQLWQT